MPVGVVFSATEVSPDKAAPGIDAAGMGVKNAV